MKLRTPSITMPVGSDRFSLGWLTFFLGLSGILALVYEVIWQRQFALIFGSAAPATAAVLSAYFAGLGLGAWWVGNYAETWKRPLKAYALLEFSIGLGALLVGPFLHGVEYFYPRLFNFFGGRTDQFILFKFLTASLALILPTFCMGGTLPLLGPLVDRGRKHLGVTAGWLYFINTAGAAIGALSVPFLLLPHFGMTHIVWGCAALNFSVACGAWFLDTQDRPIQTVPLPAPAKSKKVRRQETASEMTARPMAWLAFVSGFATFALQIFWNRAFAQLHENSMYSFAVIVAVTIAALALGAQFARLGLRRHFSPQRFLATAWIAAGIAIVASPGLFILCSDNFAYLSRGATWFAGAGHLIALASGLLLVPMALIGIGFPTLMELVGQDSSLNPGRALGRIFVINVVGSIAGSLVSGFWLPSWLGLWNSMIALGLVLIATGILVRRQASPRSANSIFPYVLGAITVLCVAGISFLDLPRVSVESQVGEKLIALKESAYGITAVVERPGSRRLKLNNHYGLGGTASTGDERMQAHIPLLLNPAPHRVAFLGLGTGITAGAALFHPVDEITIIELVPDVISSARDYFREANGGVIENERTHIIVDDARHALRSAGARYDVIVGDLVVPWRQGEGSLFTLEQFQAARNALSPKGVFCQWLPLYQLSEKEVDIISRTFLHVFPRAQVWRGDFSPTEPAIALIGSNDDIVLDASALRRQLATMQKDPANPQLQSAEDFWMNYIGEISAGQLDANETRLNIDDQPWVEILGPLLHSGTDEGNLFTGRALLKWEETVSTQPASKRTALPEAELAAVQAGNTLCEMTLCIYEQNPSGAKAAQTRLHALLPEDAFRQLF